MSSEKFNPGDRVAYFVNEKNCIISPCLVKPEHKSIDGVIIICDDSRGIALFVPDVQPDQGSELTVKDIDRFYREPENTCFPDLIKYKDKKVHWISYTSLVKTGGLNVVVAEKAVKTGFDGCKCSNCGNFEQYAEAGADGVFLCWSCKKNPYRRCSCGCR